MLNVSIPRFKFWKADYANLEDRMEGMVIPETWGSKNHVVPACVNTVSLIYKASRRELDAIRAVRADNLVLTLGVDFTQDLPNAQITIQGSPLLLAGQTYYIYVEADAFTIDGVNYFHWVSSDSDEYADGEGFYINDAGVWASLGVGDFGFTIYGRQDLQGEDSVKVSFSYVVPAYHALLDSTAHKRMAQSFKVGADNFYITKIGLPIVADNFPVGASLSVHILSAQDIATQVGTPSTPEVARTDNYYLGGSSSWVPRGAPTNVEMDIDGLPDGLGALITNVADIIEDAYANVVGGTVAFLDATTLANLKAKRTEVLGTHLDKEMVFSAFTQKLEAGQFFKIIPGLDGTFHTVVYEAGEPGGTPHFRDEDFISFKMWRDWKSLFQKVKVNYDENPQNQEMQVVESTSEEAEYYYKNKENLSVDTFHIVKASAQACADGYISMLGGSSGPPIYVEFTVGGGVGDTLIPSDKVKLTRARADYSGGSLAAVLFRIMAIAKNFDTKEAVITALLDIQSYPA